MNILKIKAAFEKLKKQEETLTKQKIQALCNVFVKLPHIKEAIKEKGIPTKLFLNYTTEIPELTVTLESMGIRIVRSYFVEPSVLLFYWCNAPSVTDLHLTN